MVHYSEALDKYFIPSQRKYIALQNTAYTGKVQWHPNEYTTAYILIGCIFYGREIHKPSFYCFDNNHFTLVNIKGALRTYLGSDGQHCKLF